MDRPSPPGAGLALIAIARALGLTRLEASHFLDNPAFGRVMENLGFQATDMIAPRLSCAPDMEMAAIYFRLELAAEAKVDEMVTA